MFSIRIVATDHYQATPLQGLDVCRTEFSHGDITRVPVIRVFGSTPAGQKTCMHVHGVFPYMYVPYDGSQPGDQYIRQFASSVDKALNVALGHASSNQQHVFKVTLVSGIPFYGYHEDEQTFLKIYLYNPSMIKRLADLLLGGAVLNKVFQPYEAHIPYLLQMFMDYNLYGMNMLHVTALKFRRPKVEGPGCEVSHHRPSRHVTVSPSDTLMLDSVGDGNVSDTLRQWDIDNMPQELLVEREVAGKESSCELEVDVVAADILNRLEVGDTIGTNLGLKALWDDEQQRRQEKGETEEIEVPSSCDRENVRWTRGEAALQERMRQIISDLQPYIDDDTDSSVSSGSQDVPLIASSQVICHMSSAEPNNYSQDTVLLGEEEQEGEAGEREDTKEAGDEPVISEESILRVVSSSQSFHQDKTERTLDSQDQSLARILASLGGDDSEYPVWSQSMLEEQDSVLSQLLPPGSGSEEEEEEEREMSQSLPQEGLPDMEGMESSWNSSQWVDVDGRGSSDSPASHDSAIPQLDGPVDDKSHIGNIHQSRKRLGMRGSTLSSRRCMRSSSSLATSPFSFVAHTSTGLHSSFKASHAIEPFPPPHTLSDKWPNVVVDLRSPPPVEISGNDDMEYSIAMRSLWKQKDVDRSPKQPVGEDNNPTSNEREDGYGEAHRPTLVIKFKQVPAASTGQGQSMKNRLRHAKTWISTIKTPTDVSTASNDAEREDICENGVAGHQKCNTKKKVCTQSTGSERTGTGSERTGTGSEHAVGRMSRSERATARNQTRRTGDEAKPDMCVRDKRRTVTKHRSYSESTILSKHDNIFQQMSTDFPGQLEPALTKSLRRKASQESTTSEMDTSRDLFDSDVDMTTEHVDNGCDINNDHVASEKTLCVDITAFPNVDSAVSDVHVQATDDVCTTRGVSDNVSLNIGEHSRTYTSGRHSISPWSSDSRFDKLVNIPVLKLVKSSSHEGVCDDTASVDEVLGSAMPHLMSSRSVSPDVEKSPAVTLPHLVVQSSNPSSDLSLTEMPVLIDESQTSDLDPLDLFGQWRPRSPSCDVVTSRSDRHQMLRGVTTTVSRGGCRVKLPSCPQHPGSDAVRSDALPKPLHRDRLASASDERTETADRDRRSGCRVKLPRRASESDRPSSVAMKSTVRMLLPRSDHSLHTHDPRTTLSVMATHGYNPSTPQSTRTILSVMATHGYNPSTPQSTRPVSLADRKLKLSLKKRQRQQEAEERTVDTDSSQTNVSIVNASASLTLEDKEREVVTRSRHHGNTDLDPVVETKTKQKSPQTKPKSTNVNKNWTPKQTTLLEDGRKRRSRLQLPRRSVTGCSGRTRNMVTFSTVSPLANYAGSRRVTDAQLVNSLVWVAKKYFKEYDLKKIGNEMLLLQLLKDDDIAELKLQIQQEELHKRKEKKSASTIGVALDMEHVSDLFDRSSQSESELLQQCRIETEQSTSKGFDAAEQSEKTVSTALQTNTDLISENGSRIALDTESEVQDKVVADISGDLTIRNHSKKVIETEQQDNVEVQSKCETANADTATIGDDATQNEIVSSKTAVDTERCQVSEVKTKANMVTEMRQGDSCSVDQENVTKCPLEVESKRTTITNDTETDDVQGETLTLLDDSKKLKMESDTKPIIGSTELLYVRGETTPVTHDVETVNAQSETMTAVDDVEKVNVENESKPLTNHAKAVNVQSATMSVTDDLEIVNEQSATRPVTDDLEIVNEQSETMPVTDALETVNVQSEVKTAIDDTETLYVHGDTKPVTGDTEMLDVQSETLAVADDMETMNIESESKPIINLAEKTNKQSKTRPVTDDVTVDEHCETMTITGDTETCYVQRETKSLADDTDTLCLQREMADQWETMNMQSETMPVIDDMVTTNVLSETKTMTDDTETLDMLSETKSVTDDIEILDVLSETKTVIDYVETVTLLSETMPVTEDLVAVNVQQEIMPLTDDTETCDVQSETTTMAADTKTFTMQSETTTVTADTETLGVRSETKPMTADTETLNSHSETSTVTADTETLDVHSETETVTVDTETLNGHSETSTVTGDTETLDVQSETNRVTGDTETLDVQSETKTMTADIETLDVHRETSIVTDNTETLDIQTETKTVTADTETLEVQSETSPETLQVQSETKTVKADTETFDVQSETNVVTVDTKTLDVQSETNRVIGDTETVTVQSETKQVMPDDMNTIYAHCDHATISLVDYTVEKEDCENVIAAAVDAEECDTELKAVNVCDGQFTEMQDTNIADNDHVNQSMADILNNLLSTEQPIPTLDLTSEMKTAAIIGTHHAEIEDISVTGDDVLQWSSTIGSLSDFWPEVQDPRTALTHSEGNVLMTNRRCAERSDDITSTVVVAVPTLCQEVKDTTLHPMLSATIAGDSSNISEEMSNTANGCVNIAEDSTATDDIDTAASSHDTNIARNSKCKDLEESTTDIASYSKTVIAGRNIAGDQKTNVTGDQMTNIAGDHMVSSVGQKRGAQMDDGHLQKRPCNRDQNSDSRQRSERRSRSGSEHRSERNRSGSEHRSERRHGSHSEHRSDRRHGSHSEHRSDRSRSGSEHRSDRRHGSHSEHRSDRRHGSGSEHRSERSRSGSEHRSERSRSGSEHRSDRRHGSHSEHRSERSRSGSEHRSDRRYGSHSEHRSDRRYGSGSEHRSERRYGSHSEHRSDRSRSGSEHRSDRRHGSGSEHRSDRSRSGSEHRSDRRYGSGSEHRSERRYGSHSEHRSDRSRSGSEHRSDRRYGLGSEHRSEREHISGSEKRSGSELKSISENRSEDNIIERDISPCCKRLKVVEPVVYSDNPATEQEGELCQLSVGQKGVNADTESDQKESELTSGDSPQSTPFCKSSRKRVRKKGLTPKLLRTLSVLHEKTLESLGATIAPFNTDPSHQRTYADTLYNMAILSPVSSEKRNMSPPMAVSPTLMKDLDSTCRIPGNIDKNILTNSTEVIMSPPGDNTEDDICVLPPSVRSTPPLLREASPRSCRSDDGSVSPPVLSDELSPPLLMPQSAESSSAPPDCDSAEGKPRQNAEIECLKNNQDKKLKDEAAVLSSSVSSGGSILFSSSGSTYVGGANDSNETPEENALFLQRESTVNVYSCCGQRKCSCDHRTGTMCAPWESDALEAHDTSSGVTSDDEVLSQSPQEKRHGPSVLALTCVLGQGDIDNSCATADVTPDALCDAGIDIGHQNSHNLLDSDIRNCDTEFPRDNDDSQGCHDGGSDDSHDTCDRHSGQVSQDRQPTDGSLSHTGQTTFDHLPHSSDSPVDDVAKGAFDDLRGAVITPSVRPPSRESVVTDCGVLSHTQLKEPFCSDPCDIPDTRQVGGRSLKVKSTLVSDLPEFPSCFRGIRSWQTVMLRGSCPLDSSFDLAAEIDNNPQLLAAAIGDGKTVVTPCVVPPSRHLVLQSVTRRDTQRLKEGKREGRGKERTEVMSDDDVFIETPQICQMSSDVSGLSTEGPCHGTSTTVTQTPARDRMRPLSLVTSTPVARWHSHTELTPMSQTLLSDASDGCTLDDPTCSDLDLVASTPIKKPSLGKEDLPACTPIAKVMSQGEKEIDCTPTAPTGRRRKSLLRMMSRETEGSRRGAQLSSQLKKQLTSPQLPKAATSQIDGPTLRNSFGFKMSLHDLKAAKAVQEFQYITVMSCELHIETRGDRRPDPEFDSICSLFYAITNDIPPEKGPRELSGVIVLDPHSASHLKQSGQTNKVFDEPSTSKAANEREAPAAGLRSASANETVAKDKSSRTFQTLLEQSGVTNTDVTYVENEEELFDKLVELINRWDPDILVGYEIQMLSWGYLLKRALKLNIKLCPRLSRLPGNERENTHSAEKDEYGADHMSEIHIAGRITLNLWRILRHEVTLNVYTFENVAYHVLHRRIPLYSLQALTAWFRHRTHLYRWQTIQHYMTRARGNLEIMEQLDVIGRTSEFARVFGIEFYSVLSRGTQYRVESMMLRIAKPLNYIPVTPSVQQRAHMRAPECIPLNLEPESQFYTDPVIVLDFQSLYPSIMIAYNYCFSTCLGRLEHLANAQNGAFDFSCTSLTVPPATLKKLKTNITVSPVGVAFVNHNIRKGVLPSMLEDILQTRFMIKAAMKKYKGNKTLDKLLHARQLSLKLIANVTYGYTSASFSGRMPSIEVGDSVVSKGRETLERAIELVETTPRWQGKVVYGDTDSLFVLLKGRTKQEAFQVGQEIADAVTALNPKPVKLKFEKVYLPCVLQTKKRYVGFMYETPDQKEPVFDAKGIETVRRDVCAAVSKVLERSIKVFFTTSDVSQVKAYVQTQCHKLLEGKVSMQDCIFAKEYRGLAGYRSTACVPALEIARRLLSKDHQAEPRVGERVPYVIVHGAPSLPLIQLVRQPQELLRDPELRLNGTYYIIKQVLPPLARIFSLIGIDVFTWFTQLPKTLRVMAPASDNDQNKKGTISQYFTSLSCPVCEEITNHGMCDSCRDNSQRRAVILSGRIRQSERGILQVSQICATCMSMVDGSQPCVSLDCPVLYRRHQANGLYRQVGHLEQLKAKLLQF